MGTGLVIGKFWPPHNGHLALIRFAMTQSHKVFVIICDGPRYDIPGALRLQWLQQIFPEADVLITPEDHADNDSFGWAEKTKQLLGFIPDKVFSSEDYGEPYARHLGSQHVSFDPRREQVPISGTAIRKDPYRYWEYLHPSVRAHYLKKIALVGAESCGKTTLGNALAKEFGAYIVPEYGRFYWDAKQFAGDDPIWSTEEFVHIAEKQNESENHFALRTNKILICDTNSFLTGIWHRRYLGFYSPEVDQISSTKQYDLVLFCPANIPFVQDGTRDGEFIRADMSRWVNERLSENGVPFITMEGRPEERLSVAADAVKKLFTS